MSNNLAIFETSSESQNEQNCEFLKISQILIVPNFKFCRIVLKEAVGGN